MSRVVYVTKEDLFAELEVQVATEWGRWRYVEPPLLIFEPKHGPSLFLSNRSNIWEPLPKDWHGHA